MTADELAEGASGAGDDPGAQVPFPFENAVSMLRMADESGTSVAAMMLANERTARSEAEVDAGISSLWGAMNTCIDRGLKRQGELPGGLRVKRRAGKLFEQLCDEQGFQPRSAARLFRLADRLCHGGQ